jgi:hypothetical protein
MSRMMRRDSRTRSRRINRKELEGRGDILYMMEPKRREEIGERNRKTDEEENSIEGRGE